MSCETVTATLPIAMQSVSYPQQPCRAAWPVAQAGRAAQT